MFNYPKLFLIFLLPCIAFAKGTDTVKITSREPSRQAKFTLYRDTTKKLFLFSHDQKVLLQPLLITKPFLSATGGTDFMALPFTYANGKKTELIISPELERILSTELRARPRRNVTAYFVKGYGQTRLVAVKLRAQSRSTRDEIVAIDSESAQKYGFQWQQLSKDQRKTWLEAKKEEEMLEAEAEHDARVQSINEEMEEILEELDELSSNQPIGSMQASDVSSYIVDLREHADEVESCEKALEKLEVELDELNSR